jgi:hypothetical protein
MDQDLQDLLALWLGDHDPGEARRDALLARLRDDAAFRRAFVEEVCLLGALKAVQSAEPRWLRLEDEIGWSARRREDVEALAAKVVREARRRARGRRLARWAAGLAAAVLVAGGLALLFRPGKPHGPVEPVEAAAAGGELATAIKLEDVRWEDDSPTPGVGDIVPSGRLRLRSGRLTLAFFSGVSLTVEGPADVELVAADRVLCRYGKLRARVPPGAEGFTVQAAGYEVVDLGTEFGLNLEPGGPSRVMVFDGEAAVSMLGKDGRPVRGALLEGWGKAVEVDPASGRIRQVAPRPEAFAPLGEFVRPPLDLAPGYPAAVLAANPWGYWRFESMADRRVPNEVAGRPPLEVLGGVRLERSAGGNGWAYFRPGDHAQALRMDGEWTPPRADGYAIEVWVQADLPGPSAYSRATLVGLIDRAEGKTENHLAYLELTARGRRSPHEPCAVRFLDRWPAAVSGGADVFSRRAVVPSLWHHIVGQKSGDVLELYVDGECVGTTPAKADEPGDGAVTTACRLLVGRLKQRSGPPFASEIRAFEGRLDELAVYDHPLTPEEIRRHAKLRVAGGP